MTAAGPLHDDADFAFPRACRLLTKADYGTVFQKNRRYGDAFWSVLVHRKVERCGAKLGLAIAKKRAKRAVDRNRLKRIARETFRHRQSTLAGCYLVIMNRDQATKADSEQLRHSLQVLLEKAANAGIR